jgi:hypothetical protein
MSNLTNLSLTTPALLFPAISLLLLAYTNRFLVIAQLIRELHRYEQQAHSETTRRQIRNLKLRVKLIKWMQFYGVLAFLLCTLSMTCLYLGANNVGGIVFGVSLCAMVVSLLLSLYEISISVKAINIELEDMER